MWLKQDVSPLSTRARWSEQQVKPIQNNSVTANFTPDQHSGAISAEDYKAFWEAPIATTDQQSDQDLLVAAATVQRESSVQKPRDKQLLGKTKVTKPVC